MVPRRRERIHSLRFQMLALVLLVWLVPTLILSKFIATLLPSLRDMTENSLISGADYAWAQVSENMDKLIALSRDATYEGELGAAYAQRAQGLLNDTEFVRLSRNYLERKYSREPLCICALYLVSGEPDLLLYDRNSAAAANRYRELADARVRAVCGSMDTRSVFLTVEGHIYLVRNLLDTLMKPFGTLVLELNPEKLLAPLAGVAAQWQGEQRVLIGSEAETDPPVSDGLLTEAGGELQLVKVSDSRDWQLQWRLTIPRDRVFGRVTQFRNLLVFLYALLVPLLVLLAVYMHRRFTRPISLLVDASRRIEAGEFGAVVPMRGSDELGVLGRTFSDMSTHLKELIDRTYKEEIALRDAQIQALQSRINPHFINNALEDINWQARIDGSETVSRMVNSLSVLLNATMAGRDRRLVSLREELDVADAYIYFITERFGDRLSFQRRVDESLLEARVPLLTIQPVLENAVEHGIAPAGGGRIELNVSADGDMLHLDIINTGRLIRPEDRQRIDEALQGDQSGSHVGLHNIASRLRLIYHGSASIEMLAESDRTVARIRIPRTTEGEQS